MGDGHLALDTRDAAFAESHHGKDVTPPQEYLLEFVRRVDQPARHARARPVGNAHDHHAPVAVPDENGVSDLRSLYEGRRPAGGDRDRVAASPAPLRTEAVAE